MTDNNKTVVMKALFADEPLDNSFINNSFPIRAVRVFYAYVCEPIVNAMDATLLVVGELINKTTRYLSK